nr:hypothetical protein 1 [Mute swan feces associated picorna-like virus 28]
MSEHEDIQLGPKASSSDKFFLKKLDSSRFNTKEIRARKAREIARKRAKSAAEKGSLPCQLDKTDPPAQQKQKKVGPKKGKKKKEVLPHSNEELGQFDDLSEDLNTFDRNDISHEYANFDWTDASSETLHRNNLLRTSLETPVQAPPEGDNLFRSLIDSVGSLADTFEDGDPSGYIVHIENIALFGYQMYKARSFGECFVATIAYIKFYMREKSVVHELMKLINGIPNLDPKDTVLPEGFEGTFGQNIQQKWNLFRTNTIFNKISYLISAAMSLTICSLKEITWSPLGVQLIHIEAARKHLNAVDIIDAIVDTFNWMGTTGWQVFHTGSLEPILYSDQNMVKYNADYDYVVAHADSALAGNLPDLGGFERKVDDALRATAVLQKAKPDSITAQWIQKRYSDLVLIKDRLVCKNKNTQMRFQPIGFSLHGGTAVGKTSLGKLTMNVSLRAMGFATEKSRQLTHDAYDQYQSTYTSDVEGMFLDDIANLKSDFAEGTQIPSAAIIKFFNNVAAQAVKAELNQKGVVFVNFKCGVVTTNVKELDARIYSNCPESILRRLYHVHVQIKPQYRVTNGSSLDTNHPFVRDGGVTNDIWLIDVEECISFASPQGASKMRFQTMVLEIDGKSVTCKDLDLDTYLRVVVFLSVQHKHKQDVLLRSNDELEGILYCACGLPHIVCRKCRTLTPTEVVSQILKQDGSDRALQKESAQLDEYHRDIVANFKDPRIVPHALENIVDVVVSSAKKAAWKYVTSFFKPIEVCNSLLGYSPISKLSEAALVSAMYQDIDNVATPFFVAITPDFIYNTSLFQRFSSCWRSSAAIRDLKYHAYALGSFTLTAMGVCAYKLLVHRRDRSMVSRTSLYFNVTMLSFFGWAGTVFLWDNYTYRKQLYQERFVQSRTALTARVAWIRNQVKPSTVMCVATLGLAMKLLLLWNENRKNMMPDSSELTPNVVDKQPGWFGFFLNRIGLSCETQQPCRSATTAQVLENIEGNIMLVRIVREDGTTACTNAFFPRSGVMLIPRHNLHPGCDLNVVPTPRFSAEVFRNHSPGGKFEIKADSSVWYEFPDLDLLAVWVPNCPDLKDVTKWLPLDIPKGNCQAVLKRRMLDLSCKQETVHVTMADVGHKYACFKGGKYFSSLIGPGSCMAPLVRDGKLPFIMGFHIGGGSVQNGVMQTVTAKMVSECLSELESRDHIVLSANAGILPHAQYGNVVLTNTQVHPNAHVRTYTQDNYVEILGSCKVRRSQTSSVVQSVISDSVATECGVLNDWGPPALVPNWRPFNVALDLISKPSVCFFPKDLLKARDDYLMPLKALVVAHAKREDFCPLDEHAMVCGIDGRRFIDAIPMNTSMGFPVFGQKKQYFEEVRDENVLVTRKIGPKIREEMNRMMNCWKEGVRAYPVMSACLKDEVTRCGKTKVRVFMACPVAFGLLIRKYFLPIARFFGLHPIEAEMAVGVNAMGPQWQALCRHMRSFSLDGNGDFGMDYAFYDLTMNSQMTKDSLISMILLAQWGGYDKADLSIMKMMVADLAHPVVEINGTMVKIYSSNPSGNNITVQLNCLGNSKYLRLAAFDALPLESSFRSFVAIMTYGDDNSGSVEISKRNRFNFLVIREFLKKYRVTITPPDKKAEGKEFFEIGELDFLKRRSVYIPEIGYEIGALDEGSIFKSLHANVKSSVCSPREVAASCIEGAMHEWFAHGKEVYAIRAAQMTKVCAQSGLVIPAVNFTFDERVKLWLENYCEVVE